MVDPLVDAARRASKAKDASENHPLNMAPTSFDAMEWAKAFCKAYPDAEMAVMLAWFSCALMRGFDEGWRR